MSRVVRAAVLAAVVFGACSCDAETKAEFRKTWDLVAQSLEHWKKDSPALTVHAPGPGGKEAWRLRENKPQELKDKFDSLVTAVQNDLKDGPLYIKDGIQVYRHTTDEHQAAIDKSLKGLSDDSSPQS